LGDPININHDGLGCSRDEELVPLPLLL
jgi:hypothetical protein